MGGRERRSTKRSDGKNSKTPPEPIVFFLDENFGSKDVAAVLRASGAIVEVATDHFATGTPDDVWIPTVVARGWVILTRDANIRWNHNERAALQRSGAKAFVFTGAGVRGAECARIMSGALPKIRKVLTNVNPPFVATITKGGEVAVRWPENKRS